MRPRVSISAIVWLVLGTAYFFVPLYATARFSFQNGESGLTTEPYRQIFSDPDFRSTLWLSARIALITIGIALVLMVPAAYWVHLKLPRLRPLMAFMAVLPFVVPPIVLVVGVLDTYKSAPAFFVERPEFFLSAMYVILSFPYIYWALDAGLRAIDVHTLTEAAQSLGAGWRTTFLRVILPNIRAATLSGSFLTFAIVMGEFTIANVTLFYTFSVYINFIGETFAYSAAALSLISFALTWAAMLGILFIGRGRGAREGALPAAGAV